MTSELVVASQMSQPTKTVKEPMTVINLCIEKPDIILVENLDDINTNALILEVFCLNLVFFN